MSNVSLWRSPESKNLKRVKYFSSPYEEERAYPWNIEGAFEEYPFIAAEGIPSITELPGTDPDHELLVIVAEGIPSIGEAKTTLARLSIINELKSLLSLTLQNNIHISTKITMKNDIRIGDFLILSNDLLTPVTTKMTLMLDILDTISTKNLSLINNLADIEVLRKSFVAVNSLLKDPQTIFISHTIKILLDSQDISDRVENISINLPESGFRECTIRFKDLGLYPLCDPLDDFGIERIEVQVDSESFKFLLEERSGDNDISLSDFEIWGRDITATLDLPFAVPYKTDLEVRNYTALEIINMVRGAITVNWGLPDFIVYSETYSIVDKTPIEILQDLADICGAIVMSNENGGLTVYSRDYDLSGTEDFSYDDTDHIFVRNESEDYPEGYNSVIVTGYEELTGEHSLNIEIEGDTSCLRVNNQIPIKIFGWSGMDIIVSVKDAQGGNGGYAIYLHDGYSERETQSDICWPESGPNLTYYHRYKIIPTETGEISICVEEL